jgi:hypothetical protein
MDASASEFGTQSDDRIELSHGHPRRQV